MRIKEESEQGGGKRDGSKERAERRKERERDGRAEKKRRKETGIERPNLKEWKHNSGGGSGQEGRFREFA